MWKQTSNCNFIHQRIAFFSVMRLSCNTCFSVISRSLRRGNIAEISWWMCPMCSQCWMIYSSWSFHHKKIIYNFFWWKVYIHGTANSGHACCLEHEQPCKTQMHNKKRVLCSSFKRIVILTVHVPSDGVGWGKFGYISKLILKRHLNASGRLYYHVFHMRKC